MALRIGKKKAATEDFSPESLQTASPPVIDTSAQTVPFGDQVNAAPTGAEPDFGFETTPLETTPFDATTTHAETVYTQPVQTQPVYTEAVHTEAVHTEAVHTEAVAVVAPAKKRVPLPALIGLGALGLLGLGALAWSKMTPAEETEDAPIVARHTPPRPAPVKTAPAKVIVVKGAPARPATRVAVKPVVVKPVVVKPVVVKTATTKTVTTQTGATGPGATPATSATTTTTKTTVATALVPDQQAAAAAIAGGPRVVAPVDQPAPVVFPPPAAQPGKWADPNEVTIVKGAQIAPVVAPAVKARLKALWKQGADAKHRKDFAGARRAWNQALKLAPGYPGFADSIAKLPR